MAGTKSRPRARSRALPGAGNCLAFGCRAVSSLSAAVLSACIVFHHAGSATAQPATQDARSWERLPDGRVLLEIKGVRVALPTDDQNATNIIIWEGSIRRGFDLRQAIDHPDQARQFFASEPLIYIHIPNVLANRFYPAESGGLFLGHFDPTAYESFGFSILIGEMAQNDCQSWMDEFERYRERLIKEATPTDRNGWAEFVTSRSPRSVIYIRQRTPMRLPSHLDTIVCTDLGDCSASVCLKGGHGFGYQFIRSRFQRNTWPDVVQRVADVLKYVLPDDNLGAAGR
jgi:hypothetical protein